MRSLHENQVQIALDTRPRCDDEECPVERIDYRKDYIGDYELSNVP